MVKRTILAILFFILVTGLFGLITTPALAQSCSTTAGWPGICTLQTECNEANANIAWQDSACGGDTATIIIGCCGIKPGAPENLKPGLGEPCATSKGWPGTCTKNINCPQSRKGIAYDQTACKAGGCCGAEAGVSINKVCDFAGSKSGECDTCMGSGTAAWTALGCIQTDPSLFIGKILQIGIGIGGGIAFLLILFGGFQILMSAGNPEKLNAGKELITSAVTGLLIIIFSIFILRLIGVSIFSIPEFI